jgi:hypothetical protein
MAEIRNATHETVTANCDRCGAECIFSRRDDLHTIMPIAGKRVVCATCGESFWISGDTVTDSWRFILNDAKADHRAKRYGPAITRACHAWELFMYACAEAIFMFRPYFSEQSDERDFDSLNELSRRLRAETKKFTFGPLKNLMSNVIARRIAPHTVDDATRAIASISSLSLRNPVPADVLAGIREADLLRLIEGLNGLTVGTLRNDVIHKTGYRPAAEEVERCLHDEVGLLYRLKDRLGVGDFYEFQAGLVPEAKYARI